MAGFIGIILKGVFKLTITMFFIMAILAGIIKMFEIFPTGGYFISAIILFIAYKIKMWKDAQF
jgi:hypothetical protein